MLLVLALALAPAATPDDPAAWVEGSRAWLGQLGTAEERFDRLLIAAAATGDLAWAWEALADEAAEERSRLRNEALLAAADRDHLAELHRQALADIASQTREERRERRRQRGVSSHPLDAVEAQIAAWDALDTEDLLWTCAAAFGTSEQARAALDGVKAAVADEEPLAALAALDRLNPHRGELQPVAAQLGARADLASGLALEGALQAWAAAGPVEAETPLDPLEARGRALQAAERRARLQLAAREAELAALQARIASLAERLELPDDLDIRAEAEDLAQVFGAIVAEVAEGPFALDNRTWAALFWKAGVAAILSGDAAGGARLLDEAAAVSAEPLPARALPPSLAAHLREAEVRTTSTARGQLRVHVHPAARFTLNGRPVEADAGAPSFDLLPGAHRLTFWVPGRSAPVARVVAIAEGETVDTAWYELPDEPPTQTLQRVVHRHVIRPAEPPPRTRPVAIAAGVSGARAHDRLGLGPAVEARLRLDGAEIGLGGAWLALDEDLPLAIGTTWTALGRLDAWAAWRPRDEGLAVTAGGGLFGHPALAFGPALRAGLGWAAEWGDARLTLSGAWDLVPHDSEVPRGVLGLSLTTAIRP